MFLIVPVLEVSNAICHFINYVFCRLGKKMPSHVNHFTKTYLATIIKGAGFGSILLKQFKYRILLSSYLHVAHFGRFFKILEKFFNNHFSDF